LSRTHYVGDELSGDRGEIGGGKVVRMVEPVDYLIAEVEPRAPR
jgi:hypothetical protein